MGQFTQHPGSFLTEMVLDWLILRRVYIKVKLLPKLFTSSNYSVFIHFINSGHRQNIDNLISQVVDAFPDKLRCCTTNSRYFC